MEGVFYSLSCNRTIMVLKHWPAEQGVYSLLTLQSNHYGIETVKFFPHRSPPLRVAIEPLWY